MDFDTEFFPNEKLVLAISVLFSHFDNTTLNIAYHNTYRDTYYP